MLLKDENLSDETDNQETDTRDFETLITCPECETQNSRDAAICEGCHQPLDLESIEERRARRRHPAGKSRRRPRRSTQNFSTDEASILWKARISLKERIKHELPEWCQDWITRERLRWIGAGVILLLALIILLSWPDSTRTERSGRLELIFKYPGGWREMSHTNELPEAFTVAPRLVDEGAEVALAITRNGAALAMLSLEGASQTDTATSVIVNERAEALRLIYEISTDARAGPIREVKAFDSEGLSVSGERMIAGKRIKEEVLVLDLDGNEVYVLMSAPESQWQADRQEMEQILKSARRS